MLDAENGNRCSRGVDLGKPSSRFLTKASNMGAPSYPRLVRRFNYRSAEISIIEPCRREFTAFVIIEGKTPVMLFNPVRGDYFRSPKSAAKYAKNYARGKAWKPRPKKVPCTEPRLKSSTRVVFSVPG